MRTPSAAGEVRLVTGSRVLAAPATAVWTHLTEPQRLAALNPDSLGVDHVNPPGALRVGQCWTEHARSPLGVQALATRVEEVDAATGTIRLRAAGPLGVRIETTMRVRADGEGAHVTMEHRLALPRGPLSGLTASLVTARIHEGTEAALRSLQRAAEAEAGSRAAEP